MERGCALCFLVVLTASYLVEGQEVSCPQGKFGDSCSYSCNCGTSCNSTTGVCSGGCDVGWREGKGTLCQNKNIAYKKKVKGSGDYTSEWTAGKAVDGNRDQDVTHNSCYISLYYPTFWWVDLAAEYRIHSVRIYNRAGYPHKLANCSISVGPRSDADTVCYTFPSNPQNISDVIDLTCNGRGKFFIIRNPGRAAEQDDTLNICEVEIYVCSNGTFGPNCSEFCHCLNSTCDHVTGACPGGCRSGWKGDNCSTQCSGGTFGPNCSEFCHCLNSTCDHVTGACPGGCRPGWKGVNCSTRCSVGSYGINCQKSCSNRKCNGDRSSCDHRSGSCDTGCRAGWRQSDCTQECDSLHYGTNCSTACADRRCALNTSWCDHVTGICDTGVCQAGWKGIACTEAVNATTVGPTPPSSGTVERKDIECTAGTMDIHIPRTLLPTHNVTLRDPTCVVPSNGTHLVISISFNQCGTTVSFSNDTVVFSNELVATVIKASHPSSIVDYGLSKDDQRVSLECVYKRHSSVELNYMPMMRAAHFYEKRYGNLDFEVKRYTDEQFTTEIANTDIPTGVNLNSEIFIDLVVDQHQTKDIGIYVPSCFATPTPSPTDPLFYPLIRSSCPAQADVRRFTAPDINEFRFSFLAFKFTRAPMQKPHASMPAVPMVYIHCQVSACPRGNCTSSCNSANGGRMKRAALGDSSHLISTGPFFLKTDESTTGYSSIVVAVTMSVAVAATVVAMAAIVAWRRSASKLSAYKSLRLNMDS